MSVTLRPITKENWEEAAGLTVAPAQAGFIAPNVWSIAAWKFYDTLHPLAIYDGVTMTGFLMYGRDAADDEWWLYRFMVDQRYQGRGIGRAALHRLIDLLRRLPDCPAINVGYDPANHAAERLYLGAGFLPTGVAPWGERTARRILAHDETATLLRTRASGS